MSSNLRASDPQHSATVSASAGTGKTWLLVTRLIRLLLAGERPEGILAVTFTRKAAAEMQTRLSARLLDMACCDAARLLDLLKAIDAPHDAAGCQRARRLYEDLLRSPSGIRSTTFHAFCQEILRRFPLEAGIPPGFELLEASADLQQAAWDALCAAASQAPEGDIARALESLLDACNGLDNTRAALNSFLAHRSDWWAYTEGCDNPVEHATDALARQLDITTDAQPEADFFHDLTQRLLGDFTVLLQKHATATNQKHLAALAIARDAAQDAVTRFAAVCSAFLTQKGEPLARKESKAQATSMGATGQQRFLELHAQLSAQILRVQDQRRACLTLLRTSAWYLTGNSLLAHYQRLKAEQRLLDFPDLEWQAYRLLNHGDNVHWIQYKLDQRIDHLLVDEFQDTNPTQWRLLLPLLQELAAGEQERPRSVFLVGDSKQSIYRFRRADPELFDAAQTWLQQQLAAINQPLDVSWRSAPAIIDFVNQVFSSGVLQQRLKHFAPHTTQHRDMWGQVEMLPLVENPPAEDAPGVAFRNPLQTPRVLVTDQRHLLEGRLIARRIRELVEAPTPIADGSAVRALGYNDIIILLRKRTHAGAYEQALREAGIPYASANRGTLLDSQEAKDLLNLLEVLVTPFNNLALASLLRSPLFACEIESLSELARLGEGYWIDRLDVVAPKYAAEHPLHRAWTLLTQWRQLAGSLPVHDLLDRIYAQGDIINRYQAAYPPHLQQRLTANLTRFIELALEVDSGRYPSIGHFVSRLQTLRQQDEDAPDEGVPTHSEARVTLMTIHAAKGLEAAAVFLADCTHGIVSKDAYRALVDWPPQAERPHGFLLSGTREQLDPHSRQIIAGNVLAQAREDANLFYVAATRARQLLILSGVRTDKTGDTNWYDIARQQLQAAHPAATPLADSEALIISSGTPPLLSAVAPQAATPHSVIDPRLASRLIITNAADNQAADATSPLPGALSPSAAVHTTAEYADTQTRGNVIHRMLELLCSGQARQVILATVCSEFGLAPTSPQLDDWMSEAQTCFSHPQLQALFDATHYERACNEVPVQYWREGRMVSGVIDRLVLSHSEIWVIDYKTHPIDNQPALIDALAQRYRQQLGLYCQGVRQLWPGRTVRTGLLLTHIPILREIEIDPDPAA